ncbi:DUF6340 family protein [Bacteroides stercorirosoris]|uniref:Tetratricopeptide repeat protein n=1 Tax=Bacteroides stercorirosoris TaxID=871324 RepID=A0A1M6JL87_9BACE|nr:DUF6340 family protein [Bacteroides stercorirosoris]SHJ47445.1 hypothetical protein SAMN05444350_13035 [Bacteroides stercorirosoris]
MTKYSYFLLLCCSLLLGGCQSVEQLSIDYMLPAEVSFPSSLRRVAVVNNMPPIPDNQLIVEETGEKKKDQTEVARKTGYFNGNAQIATESLAEALAHENYFDEVVICDSALRANDMIPRESTLSKDEVEELTENLAVDFLIALENVQIRSLRKIEFFPDWRMYVGTLDVKVYPTVKVYLPQRTGPMVTVSANDSIFWDHTSSNMTSASSGLITDENMLKEASEFAGVIPVKHLLPYWTTANRYLFTGGSVNMRDAAVFVRENNWEQAIELWKQTYEKKKKGKQKMYAAYNVALGYEMQDSIYKAEEWALKAQKVAFEIDKIEEKKNQSTVDFSDVPNYLAVTRYLNALQERKEGMTRLNAQMQRFKNDF